MAFPGSVIQTRAAWSAGVVSWFRANAHCHLVGAQLATLNPAMKDLNSTKAFVDYLADVSATGPFWIGLARNPWVWVEEYDQGDVVTRFDDHKLHCHC